MNRVVIYLFLAFFVVRADLYSQPAPDLRSLPAFEEYFKSSKLGKVEHLESPHFIVRWIHPRDAIIAPALLAHMESARAELEPVFKRSLQAAKEKAPIEIYPDLKSFSDVSGLSLARFRATGTIALTLQQRLMILSPRNLEAGYPWAETTVHEYTHYLIRWLSANYIPIWLHEGTAQLYQGYPYEKRARLTPSQWGLFKKRRSQNKLLSLRTLQEPFPYRETPEEAELAYIQALLFTDWLNQKCGVVNLISWAELHKSLDRALEQCTKMDEAKLGGVFISQIMKEVKIPQGPEVEFYARDFESKDPVEVEGRKTDQKARNYAQLSSELFTQGRYRASGIEMTKALSAAGVAPPSWRRQLAVSYLKAGKNLKAESALKDLLRDFPQDAAAWYLLGMQKFEQKNEAGAWQYFLRAFYVNPFLEGLEPIMEQMRQKNPALATSFQLKEL